MGACIAKGPRSITRYCGSGVDHADDAFYQQEEIVRAIQLVRDMPQAHTVIPVILDKLPQGAGRLPYGMSSLQTQDATRPGGLQRVAAELVIWLREHQQRLASLLDETPGPGRGVAALAIRSGDPCRRWSTFPYAAHPDRPT